MLTQSQQLQSFYLALFDRAVDPTGLKYWSGELQSGRIDLDGVLNLMLTSDELLNRSENLFGASDSQWVTQIYERIFARDAEVEGIDYWSDQALMGQPPETLLKSMIHSASVFDAEAIDAYTSIADFYSSRVTADDYDADKALVLDGFRSNEQLYQDIQTLADEREALFLDQAGSSLEGRPIYSATVGEGERRLMVVTQQHGDEPTGTEAAMLLLEWLSGDSDAAQALREQVTLTVMPRVNPDGFARWEKLVSAELLPDTTIDPRRNSADIDLNRTWDAQEQIEETLIPEALAVSSVIDAVQPELILDFHNQNNYLNEHGELETLSLLWPTNSNVEPSVTDFAQQSAVALVQGVSEFEYGYVSLFPGGDTPQIARNGIAIEGVPTLLIEQRGLEELELKALEGLAIDFDAVASALTLEGLLGMLGVIESLSSGQFDSIDPQLATLIPERGERAPFDELYAAEVATLISGFEGAEQAEGASSVIGAYSLPVDDIA